MDNLQAPWVGLCEEDYYDRIWKRGREYDEEGDDEE